jgi:chromosome segregation ATPase
VKIGLSGDHFGKVRNLIGDLIDRLIKDQQRDETMKAYCDQQLTETAAIRDQAQMAVEEAEAKESFIISEIARLTKMIEEDQANIAKNKKAVDEMTTLRNGEHADNMQTIEVAKGGEKAVDFAIQVLQEFYENGGGVAEMGSNPEFIQIHQDPEDADREGNSVASLAPNEAQGTYKGSQLRGGLVIELLQTIKEDFYDTENSAKEGEDAAVKDYNSDKSGLDIEVENLRKEIATELSNQNDDNSVLAETKQDIKDHKSEAADATEAAERMQALCSKGQSTLKDKEAAREKEIAALKEAIDLLNGLEKN